VFVFHQKNHHLEHRRSSSSKPPQRPQKCFVEKRRSDSSAPRKLQQNQKQISTVQDLELFQFQPELPKPDAAPAAPTPPAFRRLRTPMPPASTPQPQQQRQSTENIQQQNRFTFHEYLAGVRLQQQQTSPSRLCTIIK
jgi:hypothetical protein